MSDEKAPSIRDDFNAVVEELTAAEEEAEAVEVTDAEAEPEAEPETVDQEAGAEETTDEAAADDGSAAGEEAADEEDAEDTEQAALAPPQHWEVEDQEGFAALNPEAQAIVLGMSKRLEAKHTERSEQLAREREAVAGLQEINTILEPHRAGFQLHGLDDAGAVRRLIAAHATLTQSPREGVEWLREAYGLPIQWVGNGSAGSHTTAPDQLYADDLTDPEISALNRKVEQGLAEIRQAVAQNASASAGGSQADVIAQIEAFRGETDEQGNLKHPFFSELETDMTAIASAIRAQGGTPVLQDVYDRAAWANPSVREKILANQNLTKKGGEKTVVRASEAARAEKAKSAKTSVKSTTAPSEAQPPKGESVRETLQGVLNEA